nr:hypothetical protein [Marseillevirus cajuinensis]
MSSTVFLSSEGNSNYCVFWSREGRETDFVCKRTMRYGRTAYFNLLREMDKKYARNKTGRYIIHSLGEAVDTFRKHCVVFESDILIDKIKKAKERLEVLEAVRSSIEKKLSSQNFHILANSKNCVSGRSSLCFELIRERENWRNAVKRTERRFQRAKALEDNCKSEIEALEKGLLESEYQKESHCLVSEVFIE